MKKIVGVFWHTSALRLKNIAEILTAEADIKIYSTRTLEQDRDEYDSLCGDIDKADIPILNLPNGEEVCSSIKKYAADREI